MYVLEWPEGDPETVFAIDGAGEATLCGRLELDVVRVQAVGSIVILFGGAGVGRD